MTSTSPSNRGNRVEEMKSLLSTGYFTLTSKERTSGTSTLSASFATSDAEDEPYRPEQRFNNGSVQLRPQGDFRASRVTHEVLFGNDVLDA